MYHAGAGQMNEQPVHLAILKLGSFPLHQFPHGEQRSYKLLEWLSQNRRILDCDVAEYQPGDDRALTLRFRSGVVKEFVPADLSIKFVFREVHAETLESRKKDVDIFMIVPALAAP